MKFIVQPFKIGDKQMLPLPKEAIEKLGIEDRELIQVIVKENSVVIKRAVKEMEEKKVQTERFLKQLFEERADVFRALAESEKRDAERLLDQNE